MKFKFNYDSENDILMIYDENSKVKETVEFKGDINFDLDNKNRVVGIEIFDANLFFEDIRKKLNSSLENVESIEVIEKSFRNNWYPILKVWVTGNKNFIEQPLPLLSKKEFVSPLLEVS